MSVCAKCGVDCELCDCGRTDNPCKWKEAKRRGRLKALGLSEKITPLRKKESKADKKKRRKKGRR